MKVMQRVMRKTIASVVVLLVGSVGIAQALNTDEVGGSVYVTNEYVYDRVIEVPYKVKNNAKCGQWWQMLHDTGFSDADILKADRIIFRESRCGTNAINRADPNRIGKHKGSFGLFQINLYWIKQTRWYPKGFLQTRMQRKLVPTDLLLPDVNIAAALEIIKQNRADGGCGWSAWRGC